MRLVWSAVAAMLWSACWFSAVAAEPSSPSPALGIAMESVPYPFPVSFMALEIEGQPLKMAYMDVRSTTAPSRAVLLLHGKNFYGSYWAGTVRALASAGYRVIAPDQIGFGKSSKPDIHYSLDLFAANTARLLDELKVAKAAVIGHSMGGMLAVRFARTYPDRVSQLVLEDPIGLEDYRLLIPPQPTDRVLQDELNTSEDKYRAFVQRYFAHWRPEYEQFVEIRTRISMSPEFPRWAKASALTYQMVYQQPVRYEFSLIKPVTLLIIGQKDRTVVGRNYASPEALQKLGDYPQLGRAAARDIPNCKLVEFPDVGHIPHLETPDKFNDAVVQFLKQ